ncbi:MAG: DUF2070 family protein [Thermoplasmata archaeon]
MSLDLLFKEGGNAVGCDSSEVEKTASSARFVFRSPPLFITMTTGVLGYFFGLFLVVADYAFNSLGSIDFLHCLKLAAAHIPLLLFFLFLYPAVKKAGGKFYFRRAGLLYAGTSIVFLLSAGLFSFFSESLNELTIITAAQGYPAILFCLVLLSTSFGEWRRTILFTTLFFLLGTVPYIVPFLFDTLNMPQLLSHILFNLGVLALSLISSAVIVFITDSFIKKTYSFSGVDLVLHTLDHWTEGGRAGASFMEKFLSSFATPKKISYDTLVFKNIAGEIRGIIVVPSAHPGPLGELGSSNMPYIVSHHLEKEFKCPGAVHVYHGASTHDENLASHLECEKFAKGISKYIKGLIARETPVPQRQKIKSPYFRSDAHFPVIGIGIGARALVLFCPTIKGADDIEPEAVLELKENPSIVFVDAHNCISKGVKNIKKDSPAAKALLEDVSKVLFHLDPNTVGSYGPYQKPTLVGFSGAYPSTASGLGKGGVRALALAYADGVRICLVLLDGNNIVQGLREEIRDRLLQEFTEAEILTTDSHITSTVPGGYNPVGLNDKGDIVEVCVKAALQAKKRLEPASVVAGRDRITLMSYSRGETERLSHVINCTFRRIPAAFMAGLSILTAGIAALTYLLSFL